MCIGTKAEDISGSPNPKHVSTSYVERQNLTMRMSMRRSTRLTNGQSKKVENHGHAVAIHYMQYNFGRVQKGLGGTPAMKAGPAVRPWTIEEIVLLADGRKAAADLFDREADR